MEKRRGGITRPTTLVLVALLALVSSGCPILLVGGAVGGGAYAGKKISDQKTEKAAALEKARGIIVTAGPLSQPNEVLGEVHADTVGTVNVGAVVNDSLFRAPAGTAVQKTPTARTEQMNEALKIRALELFGDRVDAVINVTYQTHPDGDVFADGLAVHFTQAQQPTQDAPAKRSTQERLDELKSLLDKGSITSKEYSQKKEAILKEL